MRDGKERRHLSALARGGEEGIQQDTGAGEKAQSESQQGGARDKGQRSNHRWSRSRVLPAPLRDRGEGTWRPDAGAATAKKNSTQPSRCARKVASNFFWPCRRQHRGAKCL